MGSTTPGGATVAAVDLGASSGRVMVGRVESDRLELEEAHRFANIPVEARGTLHWDILSLFRGVLDGLRAAGRGGHDLAGIGIDSWAIDYGLLDSEGNLLGNPVHYRDPRTGGVMAKVLDIVPADELYRTTGIQQLPFNTLYQLVAATKTPQLRAADTLLQIPDLIAYWLTGEIGAEATNASTTQLYDVRTRRWATDLMERLGLPVRVFPELREPGDPAGRLLPRVAEQTGLPTGTPVIAVGSHDTASAVVGVPARGERFAYISCGTWALVGLELDGPVLSEASRLANFTNEGGVDGRIRYLRNVMGLWLLQESMRWWEATGSAVDLSALLAEAARVPAFAALVDPDRPEFLSPGDMPARIAAACRRTEQSVPDTPAQLVRCILDSLAVAFRRTVREAQELSGHEIDVVHLVGGGVRNGLLCQLTADACNRPVLAGPVEAASLGNALVQARTLGAIDGGLAELRALITHTHVLSRYEPTGDDAVWAAAERRVYG
jgi:rhamnulokinase